MGSPFKPVNKDEKERLEFKKLQNDLKPKPRITLFEFLTLLFSLLAVSVSVTECRNNSVDIYNMKQQVDSLLIEVKKIDTKNFCHSCKDR